jgi:hypothetical protein
MARKEKRSIVTCTAFSISNTLCSFVICTTMQTQLLPTFCFPPSLCTFSLSRSANSQRGERGYQVMKQFSHLQSTTRHNSYTQLVSTAAGTLPKPSYRSSAGPNSPQHHFLIAYVFCDLLLLLRLLLFLFLLQNQRRPASSSSLQSPCQP